MPETQRSTACELSQRGRSRRDDILNALMTEMSRQQQARRLRRNAAGIALVSATLTIGCVAAGALPSTSPVQPALSQDAKLVHVISREDHWERRFFTSVPSAHQVDWQPRQVVHVQRVGTSRVTAPRVIVATSD